MSSPAQPVKVQELDRLSLLDTSFLHLARDVQRLHVGSALLFEGPAPDHDDLCAAIDAKLASVPRYRQRVKRVPLELGRPVWVDDQHFQVRNHVRRRKVRAPGTDQQVRTLAARMMPESLDPDHPLWEMWLVTGVSEGRWAIINKVHHAMIDGISGNDIMSVLLDRDPSPAATEATDWQPGPEPSSLDLVAASVVSAVGSPFGLAKETARALRRPQQVVRAGAKQVSGLAKLGALVARPESVLTGPLGTRRRWAWARADLADVKRVKVELGGTVNDVVLAAITGGLRTFLQSRGETVDGRTVRSMVPVSTRQPGVQHGPGNHVSAVLADLPVGLDTAPARLAAISSQLSDLKNSGMAEGVDVMLAATGLMPPTLLALGTRAVSHLPQRTISTVTTNVPGPQVPLYLRGARMLEMFPYVPLASEVRITIGIVSYVGEVTFGLTGDYEAVPDLDVLAGAIGDAMTELVALVSH